MRLEHLRRAAFVLLIVLFLVSISVAAAEPVEPEAEVHVPSEVEVTQETQIQVTVEEPSRYEDIEVAMKSPDGRELDYAEFDPDGTAVTVLSPGSLNLPGDQVLIYEVTYTVDGETHVHEISSEISYDRFVRDYQAVVAPMPSELEAELSELLESPETGGNGYLMTNETDSDLYLLFTDRELEPGNYVVRGFEHPAEDHEEAFDVHLCIYGEHDVERVEEDVQRVEAPVNLEEYDHGDVLELPAVEVNGHAASTELYTVTPEGGGIGETLPTVSADAFDARYNATATSLVIDASHHKHLYNQVYGVDWPEPYLYVTDVRGGDLLPDGGDATLPDEDDAGEDIPVSPERGIRDIDRGDDGTEDESGDDGEPRGEDRQERSEQQGTPFWLLLAALLVLTAARVRSDS